MEMRRNNGRTERKVSRQLKSVRSVWEWCLHVVAHVNSLWFSFLWHCSFFWFDHCIVHVCTIIVVASFMSRIKTEYVYRRHSSLTIQWMLEAQRALYYHMAVFDSFGLFQSHFYHLFIIRMAQPKQQCMLTVTEIYMLIQIRTLFFQLRKEMNFRWLF